MTNKLRREKIRADRMRRSARKIYGLADIAEALGIERRTMAVYHHRGQLPEPDDYISNGQYPVWRAPTIEPWIKERKIAMIDAECDICSGGGIEAPATRRVLGKAACDQCAKELEGALQIGPAIWMVEVSDGEEYEGYEEADYGTIDFGPYTLGWRDREAAEAYAQRAGAEVREGFVVRVIGGDVGDALEAAGIADGAGFDGPAGVVWPHDDEEGLRKRLLYGAEA